MGRGRLDHTSDCSRGHSCQPLARAGLRPFGVLPTLPSSLLAWQALGGGSETLWKHPPPCWNCGAAGVSRQPESPWEGAGHPGPLVPGAAVPRERGHSNEGNARPGGDGRLTDLLRSPGREGPPSSWPERPLGQAGWTRTRAPYQSCLGRAQAGPWAPRWVPRVLPCSTSTNGTPTPGHPWCTVLLMGLCHFDGSWLTQHSALAFALMGPKLPPGGQTAFLLCGNSV